MDQIKGEALRLLDLFLQNPASDSGRWITGVIAVLVLAWTFLRVGDRMDLPNVGIFSSFMYTGLGAALVLIGMAAAHVYLPQFQKQVGEVVFYSAAATLVSLAIVVPIVNTAINGKYLGTLIAWATGLASALVAVAIVTNVFAFIDSGGQVLKRGAEHNEATKQMLK